MAGWKKHPDHKNSSTRGSFPKHAKEETWGRGNWLMQVNQVKRPLSVVRGNGGGDGGRSSSILQGEMVIPVACWRWQCQFRTCQRWPVSWVVLTTLLSVAPSASSAGHAPVDSEIPSSWQLTTHQLLQLKRTPPPVENIYITANGSIKTTKQSKLITRKYERHLSKT